MDTTTDWNTYTLNINSDSGTLSVKWQDTNTLALYANLQYNVYFQSRNNLQTFYEYFPRSNQFLWDQRHSQGVFDLPKGAKILDIGCGLAVVDLLLAQYIPDSVFYLLDIEHYNFNKENYEYFSKNYQVYHSWQPIRDAIQTTGLDTERFKFINPTDTWPEELDAITAYYSYCWHFPRETYWSKVLNHLRIGGKLVLDIRHMDNDTVGIISEAMRSEPIITWYDNQLGKLAASDPYKIYKANDFQPHLKQGFKDSGGFSDGGARYRWIRC